MKIREIRPRSPKVDFKREAVPNDWFGGNVVASQMVNGLNLLFPAGERFFIRSVRKFLDDVKDPELLQQIRGFAGQEGRHAKAHEDFFEILAGHGYDLAPILAFYEKLAYGVLERVFSAETNLAVTAASEHFTAIMADDVLRGRILDSAHPVVRELLYWHAAEEIEHKSVAFDVLRSVDPSYSRRVRGMAIATLCLGGFWFAATASLLIQDGRRLGASRVLKDLRNFRKVRRARPVFLRGIREYLKPGFHPSNHDNLELAARYLQAAGIA